jgi:hypothetical protein
MLTDLFMGFFIKQISKKSMYITEEIKKKIKNSNYNDNDSFEY